MFLLISTDFTPTLEIPSTSLMLKLSSSNNGYEVEPHAFTICLLCHLRNSLRPVIPDNAWTLRMTAAAGTELAGPYSSATVIIFTDKSSLQPEGLPPARGVAPSGFPPL